MGRSCTSISNSKWSGGIGKGKRGKSGAHYKGKPTSHPPRRHKKVEVTFNPTDRHDYLTGFSSRKKERRAFGLAMQKVKDRQAKLEDRKEQREAQLEKIEDIERNKETLRKGVSGDTADIIVQGKTHNGDNEASDGSGFHNMEAQQNEKTLETFWDERTTHQFGGLVSVTTTFGIPFDDDDDNAINSKSDFFAREKHGVGHIDKDQRRAGNVSTYISEVKGIMGQRKCKNSGGGGGKHGGKKGQHGASTMKGMGNGASLKMAKKTLAKFSHKKNGSRGKGEERGGGGKGKKRKGRR